MINQVVTRPVKTKPRFFYGYIIVVSLFVIEAAMIGPRNSFGVFFKPLIAEFGWARALISGAFSVSTIMHGLLGVVMGEVNDRLGPRIVMTICGLIVGSGFMLMSLTSAVWQFYLFYSLLIGIGMGGVYVPIMSTIARWFVERRSLMSGIIGAGGGIGAILTPPIINWLIFTYGWRNACVILGAFVLVIIILAAQFLKRDPTKIGQVPYGEKTVLEEQLTYIPDGLSLKETIATKQFWMGITMLFCFGFSIITILVHIVPHAIDLGISAADAANILAIWGVAFIASGILLGGIADRIGVRRTTIICFILMSAALFWLPTVRGVWMFYLFTAIFAFGSTGFGTITSPLVAELFGLKSHGLILGVHILLNTIGGAVGPLMAGYIFDTSGSYYLAFLVSAAFAVAALILAVLLRPVKR